MTYIGRKAIHNPQRKRVGIIGRILCKLRFHNLRESRSMLGDYICRRCHRIYGVKY